MEETRFCEGAGWVTIIVGGMMRMDKFSKGKGMACYACRSRFARPRDIGGTLYFLCDECYEQHIWANSKAVECLRSDRGSKLKPRRRELGGAAKYRFPAGIR